MAALPLDDLQPWLARAGRCLIGGAWRAAASGAEIDLVDPSTAEVIAKSAAGESADIDLAVAAARGAFRAWSRRPAAERGKLLWALSDVLEKHAGEMATIETLNAGKPIADTTQRDVPGAVATLRYMSGWADKVGGETVPATVAGDWHTYTVREAIGVVGIIVPWNFPLNIAVTHMAAALAAGCTVVLKPAEQTPLSAIRLCELAEEVGFPPGVINLVTGYGATAGAALAAHPDVDKIAFTGSTQTGRAIVAAGLGNMKRVTLELGGKSPSIVFPDADLGRAIPGIAGGIFYNTGQVCAAGSRLYAHKSGFDRVVEGVVSHAEALRVGPGFDPATQTGPLISAPQRDRVLGYIESGVGEGATIATGGCQVGDRGYFVAPTVLVDVASSMKVMREEIFGPVLCVTRFDDDDFDTIMAEANNSPYGLIAAVWTRDLATAHRAARELKAGVVRINSMARHLSLPFGGFKQSGWGRENGRAGVEAYTELKSVSIAL